MTPQAALIDLLARTAAGSGGPVFLNEEELSQWPAAAVAAMKSQKLLARARPANSVVCPGCEHECIMPVHSLPRAGGQVSSFVVCDKRSDINRVPVSADRLKQWRTDAEAVAAFVAASLGIRRTNQPASAVGEMNVGMAAGDKRRQMLSLRADPPECVVVAGSNTLLLADLIDYVDGQYSLDALSIRHLVDSATTVDPRYTPSCARREVRKQETASKHARWRKAYRELRKRRPNMSKMWYSEQIAKQDIGARASAETIRKQMTK